ncbi:MAG: AbrB/MazE/SpoVT family DNA-binding domain-containing protein [Verrucomicrobiaceae bacterium]|nr:AbrB/MazE/SpoVT family DNA-binding domain-containing protein [Verrucomicrobiaceae bacterium]
MKGILILDETRRVTLPKQLCDKLSLRTGDSLAVIEEQGGILLKPKTARRRVKLVKRGGLLVATGFPKGVSIAEAIEAEREESDLRLQKALTRRQHKARSA